MWTGNAFHRWPVATEILAPVVGQQKLQFIAESSASVAMEKAPLIGIVDDDPDIPAALGSLIRSFGYRVECFSSAVDLLAASNLLEFSCIISDIHMPRMSGLELASEIQSISSDLPIILMTGRFEHGLQERALASGAKSLVTKPFGLEELVQKLHNALAAREQF